MRRRSEKAKILVPAESVVNVNKLISVVVPVYNKSLYLAECIESIISQTYRNLEIILVNDGSSDNSLDICKMYEQLDERVIVVDKPNAGVSSARNAGLEIATGDYIGFVDADDFIDAGMYSTLLEQITRDGSDVCTMINYSIRRGSMVLNTRTDGPIEKRDALKELLLLQYPASMCVSLFSADVIKKCKADEELHFFEDFEQHFRILLNSRRVSISTKSLYIYRVNESSINRTGINDKRLTCLTIYDKLASELSGHYDELIEYSQFFRAHALISIIASLGKTYNPAEQYYMIVRESALGMLPDVVRSEYVPWKYILAIACNAASPKLSRGLLKIVKYR